MSEENVIWDAEFNDAVTTYWLLNVLKQRDLVVGSKEEQSQQPPSVAGLSGSGEVVNLLQGIRDSLSRNETAVTNNKK